MKSKHNPKLRKDLTYDEFVQLADRKPDLEGEWIYRLEQTEAGDMPECPYPKFELGMTHTFLFQPLKWRRDSCAAICTGYGPTATS